MEDGQRLHFHATVCFLTSLSIVIVIIVVAIAVATIATSISTSGIVLSGAIIGRPAILYKTQELAPLLTFDNKNIYNGSLSMFLLRRELACVGPLRDLPNIQRGLQIHAYNVH